MAVRIVQPAEAINRNCKLFISSPMYGGQCAGLFTRSMMHLSSMLTHLEIDFVPHFLFNESLITRARNYCADEFMRSDCTHMIFIDSDIGFNPADVIALMCLQSPDSPYDIIGGPYPKKTIAWEKIKMAVEKGFANEDPEELSKFVGDYVFNPKDGKGGIPIGVPAEVLEIGTGFMMIRRKTFEVLNEKHPELLYRPDHARTEHFNGSRPIMQYFQAEIDRPPAERVLQEIRELGPEPTPDALKAIYDNYDAQMKTASNRYLSEDYWFCQMVNKAGLKTWLCPWMQMQHVGSYIFGGSVMDLSRLGAAATADPAQLQEIQDRKNKKKEAAVQTPVEVKKTKGIRRGPKAAKNKKRA